jgi:hypothetical protein
LAAVAGFFAVGVCALPGAVDDWAEVEGVVCVVAAGVLCARALPSNIPAANINAAIEDLCI